MPEYSQAQRDARFRQSVIQDTIRHDDEHHFGTSRRNIVEVGLGNSSTSRPFLIVDGRSMYAAAQVIEQRGPLDVQYRAARVDPAGTTYVITATKDGKPVPIELHSGSAKDAPIKPAHEILSREGIRSAPGNGSVGGIFFRAEAVATRVYLPPAVIAPDSTRAFNLERHMRGIENGQSRDMSLQHVNEVIKAAGGKESIANLKYEGKPFAEALAGVQKPGILSSLTNGFQSVLSRINDVVQYNRAVAGDVKEQDRVRGAQDATRMADERARSVLANAAEARSRGAPVAPDTASKTSARFDELPSPGAKRGGSSRTVRAASGIGVAGVVLTAAGDAIASTGNPIDKAGGGALAHVGHEISGLLGLPLGAKPAEGTIMRVIADAVLDPAVPQKIDRTADNKKAPVLPISQ